MMSASPTDGDETLVVRCDCGFEARGSADEVVAGMRDHAKNVHNMSATREQILERAKAV
jgi:predicted small metal-binding protein